MKGPFDRTLFIVIWETTRACALACVHCRAEAMPHRDPRELTTDEGRALIDRVAAFGEPPPLLVLTGGAEWHRGRHRSTPARAARRRRLPRATGLMSRVPFGVKTTDAPHVHRVLTQRRAVSSWQARPPARAGGPDRVRRAGRTVTDGNGFVLVDHTGNICPSGFLPLAVGNVRHDDLVAVYRGSGLFTALRDPAQLGGRCGRCEYRETCGGSRARAFAAAGDPLGEDPGCAWQPAGHPVAAIAGGSDAAPAVSESAVMQALGTVLDPELGMSIVDLGLVDDVRIENSAVGVTMTLTAPGCPIHDVMPDWVRTAVMQVPGVDVVDVALTFEPPWTSDRIRTPPAAER